MDITMKALFGKLNEVAKKTVQDAMSLALSRTNHTVEIEHLLYVLADTNGTDFKPVLNYFDLSSARAASELARTIERFKTGSGRNSLAFSPKIPQVIQDAWLYASCEENSAKLRTGHLILAILANRDLRQLVVESVPELRKIQPELLRSKFNEIVEGSKEQTETFRDGEGQSAQPQQGGVSATARTAALDQFTIDLTAQAKAAKIDPILGRDGEIRQVIDILTRRRKNNPILTGEAGVGKTAVVEGLALRIAAGDVPESLKKVVLRTLDLGALQAGAGVKGEFESRLKSVIDEVKGSVVPVILFIDEAHTLIGAGNQAGQGDAANLLKPALARGEFRTIAATTWSEYKQYFEKDAALARRFQNVKVEEPSDETAINMMRGLVGTFEKHHGVRVLDEAVVAAVKLSKRYITARQLPDKSVDVLDTACGRVAMGHVATPASIEDIKRNLELLGVEIQFLARETATGTNHQQRISALLNTKAELESELEILETQLKRERELVEQIKTVIAELEQNVSTPTADKLHDLANTPNARRDELARLTSELEQLQGERPLVHPCVTSQSVAEVISNWTGIPAGRMLTNQIKVVLSLEEHLGKRVMGQNHALEVIGKRIRTSRSNLTDPRRPVGVFLLLGTSGVGKTETAKALAEAVFGGEHKLITVNMSEYQEKHTVSLLKGSPPGYVGYGQGGVLTEAVRRNPYSVVLLDEVEKAHKDVLEIFYRIFDEGMLEDSEGRMIDFKNTIILLTSNLSSDIITELCSDPEKVPTPDEILDGVRQDLIDFFTPALLGRITVVPYYPLSDEAMKRIVTLQLDRIGQRVAEHHKASFTYEECLVDAVLNRCKETDSGARNIDRILTGAMLPDLATEFLVRLSEGVSTKSVSVGLDAEGNFTYQLN